METDGVGCFKELKKISAQYLGFLSLNSRVQEANDQSLSHGELVD